MLAEACEGETIVLMDGPRQVTLAPRGLDLEEDSPELEAELLKAADGPFPPYSSEEMRAACEQLFVRKGHAPDVGQDGVVSGGCHASV